MKKFIEICEEIKTETRKAESAKKGASWERYDAAADRLADILAAYHNGNATEAERDEARAEKSAAREEYKRAEDRATLHRIRAEILKENAKQAFYNDYIGIICDIWNKYEGKPHGEKTADKIRAELRAATGQYISICTEYNAVKIRITTAPGVPVENFEIGTKSGSERARATDENNKISPIDRDALRVWYCSEYIDDLTAHIKKLKKAHAAAIEAYEKACEAFTAYNALTRGKIERADIYHGIKNHLI